MVPKNVFAAVVSATLLIWSGASIAADYQPGDFLKLDLSKALLSPQRLGPEAQFAPFPIEAAGPAKPAAQANAEPKIVPAPDARKVRTARVHIDKPRHAENRSRGAARTKLAHRHGNPLDAEAMDRRIQVWPCKSGGICDWQRH
jgi:hypothetical protein